MTGRLSATMQENLLRLLLAISEANGDEAVKIILAISETADGFDEAEFTQKASRAVSERVTRIWIIRMSAKPCWKWSGRPPKRDCNVPSELTLLGKTLLQLEEVGKILSPTFNPSASVRRNIAEIMTTRMRKAATPGHLFGTFLR